MFYSVFIWIFALGLPDHNNTRKLLPTRFNNENMLKFTYNVFYSWIITTILHSLRKVYYSLSIALLESPQFSSPIAIATTSISLCLISFDCCWLLLPNLQLQASKSFHHFSVYSIRSTKAIFSNRVKRWSTSSYASPSGSSVTIFHLAVPLFQLPLHSRCWSPQSTGASNC